MDETSAVAVLFQLFCQRFPAP